MVRNLDDEVLAKLKARAKEQGRSLQAEVKMILEEAATPPKLDAEAARRLSEEFQRRFKGREFPDTLEIIREGRSR
ncbi:MAG: hypothetical protein ACE5JM_03235 [Armatimonadota bacterium]